MSSQVVILTSWVDAKGGTTVNVILLVAVVYRWASQGPRNARSARSGRVFLTRFCQRHLVPSVLADDAVLITSELVGNVYLHARSAARLSVSWQAGTLSVEIADDSPVLPRRVDAGPDATSGRGLLITDALAGRWGTRLAGAGKVVWFQVWAGEADQGVSRDSARRQVG